KTRWGSILRGLRKTSVDTIRSGRSELVMKTHVLTSVALRALLRPTFVLGGLALVAVPLLGMISMSRGPEPSVKSAVVALDLDATNDPACYYESAFNSGTVVLERAAVEGR